MVETTKQIVALYVDRSTQQWVVRDREGHFWSVPPIEVAWDHRQPYSPSEDTDLEPVPTHYKYLLRLPT